MMITAIVKKNATEYTYLGLQYKELTDTILDYHVGEGHLLVDTDFVVKYREEPSDEYVGLPQDPDNTYAEDTVEQSLVIKAINQTSQWKTEQAIENIVVTFAGKSYSGSTKAQNETTFAIQTLASKPVGGMLFKRAIDSSSNELTVDEFKTIQLIISDAQKAIVENEEHAYADASGNIVIV